MMSPGMAVETSTTKERDGQSCHHRGYKAKALFVLVFKAKHGGCHGWTAEMSKNSCDNLEREATIISCQSHLAIDLILVLQ